MSTMAKIMFSQLFQSPYRVQKVAQPAMFVFKEKHSRHQEKHQYHLTCFHLFLPAEPNTHWYISFFVAKLRHHVEARTLYDPTQDEFGSQAWEYSKHSPPPAWYVFYDGLTLHKHRNCHRSIGSSGSGSTRHAMRGCWFGSWMFPSQSKGVMC